MGFVIGTDTMVRILNPKYYGNSEEDMFEAVRAMGHAGVHFVVGGRIDQQNRENGYVCLCDDVDAEKGCQLAWTQTDLVPFTHSLMH